MLSPLVAYQVFKLETRCNATKPQCYSSHGAAEDTAAAAAVIAAANDRLIKRRVLQLETTR